MRVPGKVLKGLGAAIVALVVAFVAVRGWVVPAVIVGQIRNKVGGRVEIRDWWLNGTSAGVTGLKVYDPGSGTAPWASAERVTTDLSLGGIVRGRSAPGRVTLEGPEVSLKFGEKGNLLTKVGGASAGGSGGGPFPVLIAKDARLTLQQAGRPAMVVVGVTARVGPDPGGKQLILSARSNDPNWGPFEATGAVDPAFRTGDVSLKTKGGVRATPAKVKAIPFVPSDVWKNVAPDGEVDVALGVKLDAGTPHVRTEITLKGTNVRSDTLDLSASDATGQVVVNDALVTFKGVTGKAIDGRVAADGTADFAVTPGRIDLGLRLDHINVADAPRSWQLDEAGVTGHLSGKVRLLAIIKPDGVDLSGTEGEAVVEGGSIQGIPFTSLKLVMNASGNDLRYGTAKKTTGRIGRDRAILAGLALVALQADGAKKEETSGAPAKPKIELPKSITTHLEMDDVDLSQLIAKAQFLLGFPFPIPITGRLSLKADATIPLGHVKSLNEYAFHGDLSLTHASAYKVDLGRVSARIDVEDGVINLSNLRGRLVDRPDGGYDNPPPSSGGDIPETGPLPPGAFRGSLRAGFSPPGKLTAKFDGNLLPLGELAAPALPRPTPLSGLATLGVQAEADLSAASDPAAWTASGTVESQRIRYKGAALEGFSVRLGLKGGRLDVSELTALLRDRPLRAKLGLDLKPPRAFQGVVDVAGWDLSEVLAWVPNAPKPAPVAGTLSARAEATGTLEPFAIKTDGRGSFERFQAGPVSLGAVPFHWTTRDNTVALSVTDARPFGGRVTAEADVPLAPGKPIHGFANVESIDTAALGASIPGGSLKLSGRASGKVTFSIPSDVSALDAAVKLSAPDLTVQGIPAERVEATVRAHKGALGYEVSADSLGGVIKLRGDFPLGARPLTPHDADGELRAVGFTLDKVWHALGLSGLITRLTGRGAIDTNLRAVLGGQDGGLYAHGVVELRDLRWGDRATLGGLRGVMILTPDGWRIDPIQGDLLGGVSSGVLWGSAVGSASGAGGGTAAVPRQVGFNVRVERAPLRDAVALLPVHHGLDVHGFGTLRLAGTLGESFRASGDVEVASARVSGVSVSELKVPAEVATTGGHGSGLVQVRRWSARVAGGRVHGDARFRLGHDRAFQSVTVLTDVDLESITRVATESTKPASGKVSGRVTLGGLDPSLTKTYRGKVNLTLDDASLVSVPIFRELDKFLGSARGGLFEQGELNATIANREMSIDSATLEGRLAQLHLTGTVGFGGQLNLEVLVNTNQIIPQAGSALASNIPGLRGASGRNREVNLQVTNYLSNRLLKLRVTGTVKSPSVNFDPGIAVAEGALGFFTGVLKLPLGLVK